MSYYEKDFYQWTAETAALLRDRRFDDVDTDAVVEEIESLGRREKHEVYARVLRILEHMLKLHLATGPLLESNQRGWRAPAERQRSELSRLFEDSPSLRGLVDAELIAKAYRDAAHIVALEHDLAPAPDCAYGVRAVLGR